MTRRAIEIDGGGVLAYGHYGRPVVVFQSEQGDVRDWEERGMIDAVGDLLDAGKVKLYCVPSFDAESWTRRDLSLEERAQRHGHYERWILAQLVPFVQADSHSHELIATGALVRRLPRRQFLSQTRRSLSPRGLPERRLRRHGAGRG